MTAGFGEVSRAKSWSMVVDSGSLNQVGEVERTTSSLDEIHDGAQLEQYTAINRKPMQVSEGGSDVIALIHCEASMQRLIDC